MRSRPERCSKACSRFSELPRTLTSSVDAARRTRRLPVRPTSTKARIASLDDGHLLPCVAGSDLNRTDDREDVTDRCCFCYTAWQSCKVFRWVSVIFWSARKTSVLAEDNLPCFKCNKYGHKQATCKTAPKCALCSEQHSRHNFSQPTRLECPACNKAEHSVFDWQSQLHPSHWRCKGSYYFTPTSS